ncbi:MAG TPA: RNA polymerase sigma factor [Saprospiraceae bacterium]|nr:RNA polymerase sigma factor [Saprospiraceae bacterium]HMU02373.1 RNA polymerase sigma factor [Saprospiraceae bacterium]
MIINLLNPIVTIPSLKSISDEEALEQYLLTQNVNYFNILYDRYTNKVYSKCVTMLKDIEMAEDATQEIFVKILLSLSKFSGKSKFSTWLYSITYNFCIDLIRKEKKDITQSYGDYTKFEIEDDSAFDAEIMETNVYRLKDVMTELSAEDNGILLMKYQDELSIREISEVLNKTESAVKMKILRAKERFMKIYKTKYGESVA